MGPGDRTAHPSHRNDGEGGMSAHRKAWAFYDAVHAHSGGCQICGDDDEFRPDEEAFNETGEIICGDCWEAEQAKAEEAQAARVSA
jgi:hypothetical protein